MRPSVDHIVFDGEKAGRAASLQHRSRTKHPWAMTNRGHQLSLCIQIVDELVGARMPANVIRRVAAGNDDAIEILRAYLLVRLVALYGITKFAGVGLAGFGPHSNDFRSRFLQTKVRI